jgi:hypothetical protein
MNKYYIKGDITAARRKAICEGLAMNKRAFGTSRTTYKVVEHLDASQSDSGFHDSGYCKLEVSDGKLKTDIEIIMYSTSPINRNSFDAAVTEKFESAIKARDKANDEAIKSFVELLPSGMGAVVPTVATESVVAVTTDSEPPVAILPTFKPSLETKAELRETIIKHSRSPRMQESNQILHIGKNVYHSKGGRTWVYPVYEDEVPSSEQPGEHHITASEVDSLTPKQWDELLSKFIPSA